MTTVVKELICQASDYSSRMHRLETLPQEGKRKALPWECERERAQMRGKREPNWLPGEAPQGGKGMIVMRVQSFKLQVEHECDELLNEGALVIWGTCQGSQISNRKGLLRPTRCHEGHRSMERETWTPNSEGGTTLKK